ncbi:hypothetical protein BDBG_02140 [Blastomyces gilchristii SLH14081]|uniref:Uncharacterized protein n=1 Tax=Blastomyces gilchristii (strain SLH14081) TaxID=559298 RepID=A0A179UD96_BLAGS|nr:uncharacterized protein BDBG_02140 [Blastomyces gilchristii SLH14081]OAT05810.1 hypothetical protein BDBG_02140 [Blastomyces gilchristii SLH14081]
MPAPPHPPTTTSGGRRSHRRDPSLASPLQMSLSAWQLDQQGLCQKPTLFSHQFPPSKQNLHHQLNCGETKSVYRSGWMVLVDPTCKQAQINSAKPPSLGS